MSMTILFAFLRKFWPYILGAAVIAIVYFHYMGLRHTITQQRQEIVQLKKEVADKKEEIEQLKSQLGDCQAANAKYAEALTKVNAVADKLMEVSKQQEQALGTLRAMIGKERAQKEKVIAELKDLKAKPLAKTCEAAIDELVDATKNFTPLHPSQGAPVWRTPQ